MRFRIKCSEIGSISIEAAVLMPIFLGVILVFVSIVQIISAEQILCASVVKTADKMCKWAPIYKNHIIDELQAEFLNEIGGVFKKELKSETVSFFMGILQSKEITENSIDNVYCFTAQSLCKKYMENDIFIKNNIVNVRDLNLYKSRFFYSDSNNICIKAVCNVKTYLPFEVKVSSVIDCVAWGKGVLPHISVENSSSGDETATKSIWEEENFYRGKVIRELYGSNLPDGFPVIDIFEGGMATMIKSMNHNAESYEKTSIFKYRIKSMIDELYSFKGTSFAGITITQKDMLQKRLVLVMPENEFSVLQTKAMESLLKYAASKMIVLDLQRYQKV